VPQEKLDVAVVGAGPAGISAGIYCTRFGLKTVVFDNIDQLSQAALSAGIEDYPGIFNLPGPDFVDQFKQHARKQNVDLRDEAVVGIEKTKEGFFVKTEKGSYKTKFVILATGAVHKKAGIKGEEEFAGKGVSSCATCDGPLFRGKPVVVVGGGDTALTYAIFLRGIDCPVTLIHRRTEFRAQPVYVEQAKKLGVNFVTPHTVAEIKGKDKVESVVLDDGKEIKTDAVFIAVGEAPSNELAVKLGAKTNEAGFLIVDEKKETNVPGLFAIGDVAIKPLRIISIGVGEGAIAAEAIRRKVKL